MNYLVLLVLHDVTRLNEVLSAWERTGVGEVTIIPTTGKSLPCVTSCR